MEKLVDIVGVLATDEEIRAVTGASGKSSIFIPASGVLHYHVKKIAQEWVDTYHADRDYFLGYISCIKEYTQVDDFGKPDVDRIQAFKDFLEQYVLIFHHMEAASVAPFCKVSDMTILKKPKGFDSHVAYRSIPMFAPYEDLVVYHTVDSLLRKREYTTLKQFIEKLQSGESVGTVTGMTLPEEHTEFFLWKDSEYILAVGPFRTARYQEGSGFSCEVGEELQVYPLEREMIDQLLIAHTNQTIAHLPVPMLQAIGETLRQGRAIPVQDFLEQYGQQHVEEYMESAPWKRNEVKKEEAILQAVEYYCQQEDLCYAREDLVNFHTAMKLDSLVILSGMSGIGKSSLVEIYARAVGAKFLNVPVRPAWTDDSDVLGYYDNAGRRYCPASNRLVTMLAEAVKHPETLYIICMDEMNLSRVEHYFAQFLSEMERKNPAIQLYDVSLQEETVNGEQYPALLPLGNNVRMVGTVNIDETTYHFSDKVLDRANTIELQVMNYAGEQESKYFIDWEPMVWTAAEYNRYVNREVEKDYSLRGFLWELHELLVKNGLSSGVGPRVVKRIEEYLANIPAEFGKPMLNREQAVDLQVSQRILTKLRGREENLERLLSEQEGSVERLFDQYSYLSHFSSSRKLVERKRKELELYGYCI